MEPKYPDNSLICMMVRTTEGQCSIWVQHGDSAWVGGSIQDGNWDESLFYLTQVWTNANKRTYVN
jgi:uncharacterized protein YbdZ (MbtH family)